MSATEDAPEELLLIGYEKLADHGFALPCFGQAESANAVYVARTSVPGDSIAEIVGFDLYEPEQLQLLPPDKKNWRARNGGPWIDVFLWNGEVHVGTKPEIWASVARIRSEITAQAPFSLLGLAQGVPGLATGPLARAAFSWLEIRRGANAASEWRVDTYLRGIAVRDLRRWLGDTAYTGPIRRALQDVKLQQNDKNLILYLPATVAALVHSPTTRFDELQRAAQEFSLNLTIVIDRVPSSAAEEPLVTAARAEAGTVLLMRLRTGRPKQVQIPLRVVDTFFKGVTTVRSLHSDRARRLGKSSAAGRERNTVKLDLPETLHFVQPVARFERRPDGIVYETFDIESPQGKEIMALLEEGLHNGTTHQTRSTAHNATWWRII